MRVRVPAERAFVAFTERIAEWWQPNGMFQFTPGQVGTMVFESGPSGRLLERYDDGTAFVIGQVRVWNRGASFSAGGTPPSQPIRTQNCT